MKIRGYCPMGCGETLRLGESGTVFCGFTDCPAPSAVSDILRDRETEHIMVASEEGYTIMHPLRERLNGDLFECEMLERVRGATRRDPGKYRVTIHQPDAYSEPYRPGEGGLDFERLDV